MSNRVQIKDDYFEYGLIRRRLIVSAVIVAVLITIVVGRLYVLQIQEYEHFSTLSDSNRVRIRALPPTRGLIYDRNGVVMANNLPAYRLEITREQVDDIDDTLNRLKQYVYFSDYDLKRYRQSSKRRRPYESIPLRLNLDDNEVARLAVNLHKFTGVEINARLTRNYPQGGHAIHALGYVGRIDEKDLRGVNEIDYAGTSHIGKLGLEKYYENELHGTVGIQQVEVNAKGRTLRVLDETPPISGNDLYLTIDSRLQKVAEDAFGEYNGSVVAIDPNNGEILALVSMPIFDPNLFVNGISINDYSALRDSTRRPLFNRALAGQYPPGSTVKPFLALAGLESNSITTGKKRFCGGYYILPKETRKFRDWKKWGHGLMDMKSAITQSCDVYFYDLAYKMGIDKMSPFLSMPWFPGETLNTSIGQGYFLVTPLQLANSTAALSQKGKRFRPHLVSAIGHIHDDEQREMAVEVAGEYHVIKAQNWEHIRKSMINVVHGARGTARGINVGITYKVAGKTGTAQVFGIAQDEEYDEEAISLKLRDHALFISYAPAEDPRIAVAVIVENGAHGGSVAAPIARLVMDAWLQGES